MKKKPRTESELIDSSKVENIHGEIRDKIIQFEDVHYDSIEVGMNAGFGELNDENENKESVHSYGFRTCLAAIIITKDLKNILLGHYGPKKFQNSRDDFIEETRSTINDISKEVDIKLGFSSRGLHESLMEEMEGFESEEGLLSQNDREDFIRKTKEDAMSDIEYLKQKLNASEIIDLPHDSILIKRNGEIIIRIPDEDFRKPAPQICKPQASNVKTTTNNKSLEQ
ncbi:MAG: hypothetical protein ACJAW3_000119 [Lentimonas sp.]|jgi:hypothetical protein